MFIVTAFQIIYLSIFSLWFGIFIYMEYNFIDVFCIIDW